MRRVLALPACHRSAVEGKRLHCSSCQAENDEQAETCIGCGKGLHALIRGSILSGRYEIVDVIGRGGMGVVYKARDTGLDEIVAVKVIRSDLLSKSTDAARRFRYEIKLARKVTHPNVCRIHDYGQEGHLTYIVMEHVEGTDLRVVLRKHGRMPPLKALDTILQVAQGLEAVHRHRVVHRDLKTANIMLTSDGSVKLMDFGIAKSLDSDATTGATRTGQIIGTPEYMSPEQARGESIDARSDTYALGVVLFELLTGELPFRGDTPVSTIHKLLHDPPPLDGPLGVWLPETIVPVLRKALAKERRDRHGSVAELISELRHADSSLRSDDAVATRTAAAPAPRHSDSPVPAHAPIASRTVRTGPSDPRTLHPRSWRWPIAALAVATTALLGLMATPALWQRPAAPIPSPARSVAPLPAAVPPIPPSTAGPTPFRSDPLGAEPALRRPRSESVGTREHAPAHPEAEPLESGPHLVSDRASGEEVIAPRPATTQGAPAPPEPVQSPPPAEPGAAMGRLRIGVLPYAEVSIDGITVGTTPMAELTLSTGRHTVRLTHPEYQPLQRVVTIIPGEPTRLFIEFNLDGVKK